MSNRKDLLNISQTIKWTGKPNRRFFLKHIIEKNNYTTMIEVGVRDGRTTFYLLDNIPNLIIYGVDLDTGLFYNSQVKEQYGDRLIPVQGNSSTVSSLLPSVDLIFIDADHSYNGCYKDIKSYRSKLKPNGTLCGHDIDYPGVNKAVNELIKKFEVGPNNVWLSSY